MDQIATTIPIAVIRQTARDLGLAAVSADQQLSLRALAVRLIALGYSRELTLGATGHSAAHSAYAAALAEVFRDDKGEPADEPPPPAQEDGDRIHEAIRLLAQAVGEGWNFSSARAIAVIQAAASGDAPALLTCEGCGHVLVDPAYEVSDPFGGYLSGMEAESYPEEFSDARRGWLCGECVERQSSEHQLVSV
jgi:hypothetical protein